MIRKLTSIVAALVVVVATMGAATTAPASAAWRPLKLSQVASAFASRKVKVECRSELEDTNMIQAWGYVWMPTSKATVTYIHEDACNGALAIAKDTPKVSDFYKAVGASTLVHEAYHLRRTRGNENEGWTECRAMRHYDIVLRMLGATDAVMDRLMPIMLIESWHLRAWFDQYDRPGCSMPKRYDRWLGKTTEPEEAPETPPLRWG